jgi:hypothetical protein
MYLSPPLSFEDPVPYSHTEITQLLNGLEEWIWIDLD